MLPYYRKFVILWMSFVAVNSFWCMEEGTLFDRKSLRAIVGKTADFDELAKDCVAFANFDLP